MKAAHVYDRVAPKQLTRQRIKQRIAHYTQAGGGYKLKNKTKQPSPAKTWGGISGGPPSLRSALPAPTQPRLRWTQAATRSCSGVLCQCSEQQVLLLVPRRDPIQTQKLFDTLSARSEEPRKRRFCKQRFKTRDVFRLCTDTSLCSILCINNVWVFIDSFTAKKLDHVQWLCTIRKQHFKTVLFAMRAVGQGQT